MFESFLNSRRARRACCYVHMYIGASRVTALATFVRALATKVFYFFPPFAPGPSITSIIHRVTPFSHAAGTTSHTGPVTKEKSRKPPTPYPCARMAHAATNTHAATPALENASGRSAKSSATHARRPIFASISAVRRSLADAAG